MPLYAYECKECDRSKQEMRLIAEREDAPDCDRCKEKMILVLSPTAGYVKNPAAGHTRRV